MKRDPLLSTDLTPMNSFFLTSTNKDMLHKIIFDLSTFIKRIVNNRLNWTKVTRPPGRGVGTEVTHSPGRGVGIGRIPNTAASTKWSSPTSLVRWSHSSVMWRTWLIMQGSLWSIHGCPWAVHGRLPTVAWSTSSMWWFWCTCRLCPSAW